MYSGMRNTVSTICAVALLVLLPSSAFAWGAVAHRYIMQRAIELLPAEIKPFFAHYTDELILRSNDPDLWRVVDFENEGPNHRLDLGVPDYGPYPFTALPREYGAALQKFGTATVRRHGLLPWRIAEQFGNLRRVLESFKTNFVYASGNSVLFAAALGHYVADAHTPFHLHVNYDGQLTDQHGIHSRFESELFERFGTRLAIHPQSLPPVTDPGALAWAVSLASYLLVERVLQADKAAISGRDAYDTEYFEKFFATMKPVLEQQISGSIASTAAVIAGAWEQAGRPGLRTETPRPVERVRPPR